MIEQPPDQTDPLRERFPKMKPIKSAPGLWTVNGFGVRMYGNRQADAETGTYAKTRCLCLLFIPVLALDAYRVADAENGWYFLGKEPLSRFARAWNWWVLTLMIAGIATAGWNIHTASPQYKAGQELQQAAALFESGDALKAAAAYRRAAEHGVRIEEAREGLKNSLEQALQSPSPAIVEGAFHLLSVLPARLNTPTPIVPDAFERGLGLVEKFRAADAEAALGILRRAGALAPRNETLPALEIELLREIIAAHPENTPRMVELALMYERTGQMEESFRLLMPHRERLGSTEGARILGQRFLREGEYENAHQLLHPYVQVHLEKLRAIEAAYTGAVEKSYKTAINLLEKGKASQSFYRQYENASESEQSTMVQAYIQKHMETDQGYQRALEELRAANTIINVTLDLGVVQLNRAQNLTDPAARKTELEAAEATFLAIRGVAGDTQEYKLFLGQVYYWLGRADEGRELFDELLASGGRSHPILMSLGNTLRSVGEQGLARELAEEAYRSAASDEQKFMAASFRSLLFKDVDDEIAWLQRADISQPWIEISLNGARGKKALLDGDKTAAADFFGKTIKGYENLPRSSATLNNAGLACLNLYAITGDPRDHDRGLALIEEAVSMAPSDSILLINTATPLLSRALMEVLRDSIRLELLGEPEWTMLYHLYHDEQGRIAVEQRLRESETFKKSMAYMDKALLLSPKNGGLYSSMMQLQSGARDITELRKLQQRLQTASPDFSESKAQLLEIYNGDKDADYLKQLQARIQKYEALLESPKVREHAPTHALVRVTLNSLRQTSFVYGAGADGSQMLANAIAAHDLQPSAATHSALRNAHFFKAHQALGSQNSEYAALSARTRRALAPGHLIAFVLEQDKPLAAIVRANPDVAKALALQKETCKTFPTFRDARDWALFRASDPDQARLLAAHVQADEWTRLLDELEFQVYPAAAAKILEHYWTCKLLGDEKKAAAIYQEALAQQVPLPGL